jgi:hypothetical protein
MAETAGQGSAPIIVHQTPREEIRLTLRQANGSRFVDLRTYVLDQDKGKAVPTEKGATINLRLWPQFRRAVANLEPLNGAFPVWVQQLAQDARNRTIFPRTNALQPNLQEEIYLEHQDFRGITFILLKTSAISKRGRPCRLKRLITIGPILWSQFLTALNKMEEVLGDLGLLAEEGFRDTSGLEEIHA